MKAGDTIYLTVRRQTAAEAPATGRVLADFAIDTYLDGDSVSLSPAITEKSTSADGKWRHYELALTLSASTGFLSVAVRAASGTDVVEPGLWSGDIESEDVDSLRSLFLTGAGIPAVQSAADTDLGQIVDGDAYKSATLSLDTTILDRLSISDISAGGITVEAAIMLTPGGTSYPITVAVVSGTGRTVTISWDTQQHPALSTGEFSKICYVDAQVIKTGPPKQIVTAGRYTFTQVWQRDTRTT